MKYTIKGNYFNNQYHTSPLSGPDSVEKIIKRECPSDTNLRLWEAPVNYKHIDPIIESANDGFKLWKKTPLSDRVSFLKRYQEALISKKDEIIEAIALEAGKPRWEATIEATSVVNKVDVTINEALKRIETKLYENILPNTNGHLYYKPVGPCLVIGPFNFPCHLANGQILSALISGNSIILKPSEKVTYSSQLLVDCFDQAGFPKGVINLIHGDGEIASRLLKEKSVKGVFFTGSKEVGNKILSITHKDLSKLVSLELGGKNSAIIDKNSNLDFVIPELLKSSFHSAGQRCTSTAMIIMHESIIDEFITKFHELSKKIIIDHPLDYEQEPFMGPLIDKKAVDNYLLFMGMAKREGIEEVMRGKIIEKKTPGYFVSPSIHFSKSFDKKSHFLTSEIFGPNATVIPFTETEEAINIANSTEYGLAAAVFSNDREFFNNCVEDLDVGLINFNRSTTGASPKLPFGGVKNSGNYRPASIATIDACVYQMSGLDIQEQKPESISNITGISAD